MDRASMRALYFWILMCLPCASSAAAIAGKAGGSVALTGPEKIITSGITGHLQPVMKVNFGNSKSKINLKRSLVKSCWSGAHGIPETPHVSNTKDIYHGNGHGWGESTKNMLKKPFKSRKNDRKRKDENHSETSTVSEETNGSSQEDQLDFRSHTQEQNNDSDEDFTFPKPEQYPKLSDSATQWMKPKDSPARSDSVASSYSNPDGQPSPYINNYYQNGAHYPNYDDRQSGHW